LPGLIAQNFLSPLCLLGSLTVSTLLMLPAQADNLSEAQRLLRVAETGAAFENQARWQARQLIHNYSVIINRNSNYRLPAQLQRRIADCYEQVYRWENFAQGIARILAENFSPEEIQLLIDFHRNRGMPPGKIDLFKSAMAKSGRISEQSADFIFTQTRGCVAQDAELILEHLQQQDIEFHPL
jgi:hypothetical protein